MTFHELPRKSSLGVALSVESSFQGLVLGECDQKLPGSSMKSRVKPNPFRKNSMVVSCTSVLFDEGDGFAPPIFSGRMVGDSWLDPHVRSLKTYNNSPGSSALWNAAVFDYLNGIELISGFSSLVPLTPYGALIGVDSTSLGSFNLQTSAGLPFFGNKLSCVYVDREGPVPNVYLNPTLISQMERILSVVDNGDIYSPIATHCLKDEVVTNKKNDLGKVRVFNIMSFGFNLLLKRYVAPLVSVFRDNPLFFESAIGLNIAGHEHAKMIYGHLAHFPNWMASDASNFDTTASTQELYYSCVVVLAMAKQTSYSPTDLKRLWGLLMSSIHVTHLIKRDVFFVNYTLASGYWITLFLNCVRNSLQARYAFYALRPSDEMRQFRELCHQFVLGDDNIATVHGEAPWYNQVSVAEVLKDVGSVRSSSTKAPIFKAYEDEDEVTFLKRSPRLVEGRRVWAIEEKTLWRMLNFRVVSTLSEFDHCCVILTTILAEAWMYGRKRYAFFKSLVESLAKENNLSGPLLFFPEFDSYLERYDAGTLLVWDPLFFDYD